jgi:ATPase family AAA domain-containing protein 3A/B
MLYRAAKAAKELDRSTNAKEALRLIEVQEQTKQREFEVQRSQYEAHNKQLEIQRMHQVQFLGLGRG